MRSRRYGTADRGSFSLLRFHLRADLGGLVLAALLIGAPWTAACQEVVLPSRPRPVETWDPSPPSFEDPGATLPQAPEGREIPPLLSRPAAPSRVFGAVPVTGPQAPEEPPPVEGDVQWETLFERTVYPVVLSTSRLVTIQQETVTFRDGPGLDFPEIGVLHAGDRACLADTDDGWYRLRMTSGQRGWVPMTHAAPVFQKPAAIVADKVNLRSEPGLAGQVLGSLYQGAIVLVGSTTQEWVEVRTPNLERAYVSGPFVREIPPGKSPLRPVVPVPAETPLLVSLTKLVDQASAEASYLLAVGGNEWVKGGKVGLMHFSHAGSRSTLEEVSAPSKFEDGVFFQKTIPRRDCEEALGPGFQLPNGTDFVTVAYLRGEKQGLIWTFEFSFSSSQPEGEFAIVCQEGDLAGRYAVLSPNGENESE